MRILIAHNTYQQPGGEDAAVAAEAALLRRHGHEVELFTVSNDAVTGPWSRLATAWRVPYSVPARAGFARRLDARRPDLVHVHNFFPLLTPAIYDACAARGVPVVQTLHNYRPICPGATLYRDGAPCTQCVGRSPWPAVRHRCYRGSLLGSLAVARMVAHHQRAGTWLRKVDRFVVPSAFVRDRYAAAGFPAERLVVKPNFVAEIDPPGRRPAHAQGALYVGRLAPEKGLRTLLRAWRELEVPLRIAGDGPLRAELAALAGPNVTFLGHVPPPEVARLMREAGFLVVPSEWHEPFGLVVCEAMARGLPVLAARIGALPELVEPGVNGWLFTPGDAADLARAARQAAADPGARAALGECGRQRVAERYAPEANYRQLLALYTEVLAPYRAVHAAG